MGHDLRIMPFCQIFVKRKSNQESLFRIRLNGLLLPIIGEKWLPLSLEKKNNTTLHFASKIINKYKGIKFLMFGYCHIIFFCSNTLSSY